MTNRNFSVGFLLSALFVAGFVSFYAVSHLDGLEYVAESAGFLDAATDSLTGGWVLADYAVAGIEGDRLSGGLAGVIGVLMTFALVAAVTWRRA